MKFWLVRTNLDDITSTAIVTVVNVINLAKVERG